MMKYMEVFNECYLRLAKGVDETVDSWFLMSSLGPVLSIVAIYLLFVLKIGPNFMKSRNPYNLKNFMIVYNAVQVGHSTWVCYMTLQVSRITETLLSEKCEIVRTYEQSQNLYSASWFYFFSKITDLLDTYFFVLRKKQNQVTFLHVYHHSTMVLFTWMYLKYAPGEQGIIVAILNSGVHIIMYFYYMVAAMGSQYQKYLWWKKYMTGIQLTQFILIIVYMVTTALKGCNMQKSLTMFFIINTSIFLYLFGKFYKRTYKSNFKRATYATSGMEHTPSKAFSGQDDHIKRQIDVNNNAIKATKAE